MGDSHLVEHAGKILMISVVVLSVVVIFVSFVHHYAKWFSPNTSRRRRRGDFTAGYQEHPSGVTVLRRGLDPSFLKSIPVIPFDPKEFKQGGLECSVCLSDVVEGENTRVLPKCNHGFHVECIDMWFYSNSTCPICRNPVSPPQNLLETQAAAAAAADFPTNILFWGDETQVSTLTSQLEEANTTTTTTSYHQPPSSSSSSSSSQMRPDHLVIDIPLPRQRQTDCNGNEKSPSPSPVSTSRLTRILSGSRRFINPFTHAVEQAHL